MKKTNLRVIVVLLQFVGEGHRTCLAVLKAELLDNLKRKSHISGMIRFAGPSLNPTCTCMLLAIYINCTKSRAKAYRSQQLRDERNTNHKEFANVAGSCESVKSQR